MAVAVRVTANVIRRLRRQYCRRWRECLTLFGELDGWLERVMWTIVRSTPRNRSY